MYCLKYRQAIVLQKVYAFHAIVKGLDYKVYYQDTRYDNCFLGKDLMRLLDFAEAQAPGTAIDARGFGNPFKIVKKEDDLKVYTIAHKHFNNPEDVNQWIVVELTPCSHIPNKFHLKKDRNPTAESITNWL